MIRIFFFILLGCLTPVCVAATLPDASVNGAAQGAGAADSDVATPMFTLSGTVAEATGEPLGFATVTIIGHGFTRSMQTDVEGRWRLRLPAGTYTVKVSFIGYNPVAETVELTSNRDVDIALDLASQQLSEVVITAREGSGPSTASRIDRAAMEHLQPTSFTDLLELLPGNMSHDPDMQSTNSIALRETGNLSATGTKSVNDDYAITSLGTSFIVDGAPISGDANLGSVPGTSTSDTEGKRNIVNRGVDMRTISTDNIESVDIIRGIPSAEYGNITSGVVNIKRIRRATPLTVRFKADQYSKLVSASKGFAIPNHNHIVNADFGLLDSKADPRDNLESYKRLTASLRGSFHWSSHAMATVWNVGADYTGSFDDVKIDPDLNYNKIDEYAARYSRVAVTSDLTLTNRLFNGLKTINFNVSVSSQNDVIERRKQVAPQRASVAPTSMAEGVSDGVYLLGEYVADYRSENRPLNIFGKVRFNGEAACGLWFNEYKAGVEWSFAKNYGRGEVYDLMQPLSAAWTTRPRAYSDVPALHTVSFFAEENATATFGGNKMELQVGVRGISLPSLSSRYAMSGKVYLDPRLNVEWSFPSIALHNRDLNIRLAGGYGLTSRMPTADYLYPRLHYADMVQLNYYDILNPESNSRVNLRTYIEDATNYELKPARNKKLELRLSADYGSNKVSIVWFNERMSDGFRYSTVYMPREYRKYDSSVIDPRELAGPPELELLPYTDRCILDGMSRVENDSRINKQGVEFQLTTARWQPLHTSLNIAGAWFRTTYSNSQMLYQPVSAVVGDNAVSDYYVGIYDTNDGRVNSQFNTNFMFDTQIPSIGLTFSTSLQCMWWVRSTRLRQNGVPTAYLSTDGIVRPFTDESLRDPMLVQLVKNYNEDTYRTVEIPTALYVNLKVTKKIGKLLSVAAFVNRLFDYLPDYTSNGITVRRSSEAYFGMEATLTIL